MKDPQRIRPLFQNKAPLRPIKASKVQERHQVDLVNMQSMPVTIDGVTYKYIMSVIDIFSRFVFLRALGTKESAEVAEKLLEIYNEHGTPLILQSDQGTEFKGVVKRVCEALNVRIIKSSAYHPQTQGKDERSHRTWKEKLKFDVINGQLNWVDSLPVYQQLYNESPHRSLGMATPFEVYFGRQSNRISNKLSLKEKTTYEVVEEGSEEIPEELELELENTSKKQLEQLMAERELLREKAFKASKKASQKMVERELQRNPPSQYEVGETVLIRVSKTKKSIKGKKLSLMDTCEGVILKADDQDHKYFVSFKDGNTLKQKKSWIKVDDITSLTKEDENRRQRVAKEIVKQRKSLLSTTLLDATINQVLRKEKLNGDTINLYFELLRQRLPVLEDYPCISLASTYFFPSLERSGTSYTAYISENPLLEYEHLIIPLHLPLQEHWLLVVISILSLCIYIYDPACLSEEIYDKVFDTLRTKFIARERQTLPAEEGAFLHEDNWGRKIESCPKQDNDHDCGIFTCIFARDLIFSNCRKPIGDNDTSNYRNKMANDLLELATSIKRPDGFDWLHGTNPDGENHKLAVEVDNAGLTFREPSTPKDGNCLFHAVSDQLHRHGMPAQTPAQLRSNVVQYLRKNPKTSDGTHFREFVAHLGWESYLKRMSQDKVWGDWIVLWGLVNLLKMEFAIVSSIGESGLRIISPHNTKPSKRDVECPLSGMILLGHEAESHYHSLERKTNHQEAGCHTDDNTSDCKMDVDPAEYLKTRYGEGKITEELCPMCGKKFDRVSAGAYVRDSGVIQCYADDSDFCENCLRKRQFSFDDPGDYMY